MSGPTDSGYYDEAYFERGWERGTAYENYKASAATSPTFKCIAQALATIFSPTRALEIGCATGAIVKALNDLEVEASGIDVSAWAVENALHPNVVHASASELPFDDGVFDLIYSSHSLEHLPDSIYRDAFKQMDRVASADAVQFHMLPIVGTHPYNYDHDEAVRSLKKDPTHNLLRPLDWWLDQWIELGWEPVHASVLFPSDTENVELSSGQFCLIRKDSNSRVPILKAINEWNGAAFRELYREARISAGASDISRLAASQAWPSRSIEPDPQASWGDLKWGSNAPTNLSDARIVGALSLESHVPVMMRIALISADGGVREKWMRIEPGISLITSKINEFTILSGSGDISSISEIYFGGPRGEFRISCNLAVHGPNAILENLFPA